MKIHSLTLTTLLISTLLMTACTQEGDPTPKCNTQAITYQEFKDNYQSKETQPDSSTHKTQNFLFDGEVRGTEASLNSHYNSSAYNNQQVQQREIIETVQNYDRK